MFQFFFAVGLGRRFLVVVSNIRADFRRYHREGHQKRFLVRARILEWLDQDPETPIIAMMTDPQRLA